MNININVTRKTDNATVKTLERIVTRLEAINGSLVYLSDVIAQQEPQELPVDEEDVDSDMEHTQVRMPSYDETMQIPRVQPR